MPFVAGRLGRSPVSYPTRKGTTTYNPKTRSYSGPGTKPKGAKIRRTPATVVTTSPSGHITTSGFSSPRAAAQAKQRSRAVSRRVSRIERQQAAALGFHRRTQQRASERPPQPSAAALRKRDAPISTKTVISSKAGGRSAEVRASLAPPRPPSYKPPKFQGVKTAGTPSLKELQVADKQGKIRLNKAGFVTTPKIRRVSSSLKRAEKKAAHATPQIHGLRTRAQEEFAEEFSRHSKVPPKLAGEWTLQESGGSSAGAGGQAGRHNQLGVGYPAHPTSFSESPYFNTTAKRAGRASAKWLEGKIGGAYGYKAAPSITGISKLAKAHAPESEIRAYIEGPSAWGTGHIAQSGISVTPGNPKALQRLRHAQLKARKLGLKVSDASSLGPAPKQVVTRFKAIKKAAAALSSRHIPYVWGGGHGSIESAPTGLDCSGAVSWVLNKAGILRTPLTSGSMGEVLKPGPGAVTVFYNPEHTFMKIGDEYWGTSVGDSGAGGLGPHPAPSASYLAQYNVGHVPGLGKKQALQLGFSPTASESFPGMTISSSGTTATINPDAGSTQEKAGFSKSPIKLTRAQKAHRTLKKLEQVGAGLSEKPSEGSESKANVLRDLERTYGKKAA